MTDPREGAVRDDTGTFNGIPMRRLPGPYSVHVYPGIPVPVPQSQTLVVSGKPPSKANRYRIGKRRLWLAKSVTDFAALIASEMQAHLIRPVIGPVAVDVWSYPPDRRSDLTGAEKIILDALQNWRPARGIGGKRGRITLDYGAYKNDRQVEDFRIRFGGVDKNNPRIAITITPLAP